MVTLSERKVSTVIFIIIGKYTELLKLVSEYAIWELKVKEDNPIWFSKRDSY